MKPHFCWLAASVAILSFLVDSRGTLGAPPQEKAQAAKKSGEFIRLTRDSQKRPVALETATVRYSPATGDGKLTVDLVGVVHIGDKAYYRQLNKLLDEYEVVLYELVAPPGTRVPKGGARSSNNPISMIQNLGKSLLDLESQMEQIDYTRKHFIHADLSPEQMAEAMQKRGETGLTLFLGVMTDMLRQQNLLEGNQDKLKALARGDEEVDLLSLLFDTDGPVRMKRVFAEQLADLNNPTTGLGPTLNALLIADRNQAAIKGLQKEIARGSKKIAIFYGAAHMPDMEKRLRDEFDLKRQSETWQTAWDLKARSKPGGAFLKILQDLDK